MKKKLTQQQMSERLARRKERRKNLPVAGPRPVTRKEARAIAKHNMVMEGVTRINHKRGEKKISFFAQNWRKYFEMTSRLRPAKQRG